VISQLRTHLSRLRGYKRRFGWWRTVRRAVLGPSPELVTPSVDEPSAVADLAVAPGLATDVPLPELEEATPAPEPVAHPRCPPWTPLHVFHTPVRGRKRITLVLDSMADSDRPDGVGTTIILASLLAHRCGADLRLVTRTEPPQPVILQPLLQAVGVAMEGEIQCRFQPFDNVKAELDLLDGEMLITDSWWNAAAALAAVEAARVVHLLLSDDRRADADDDERLRCESLLRRRDLQRVISTAGLRQHFVREGFDHFETHALTFEAPSAGGLQDAADGRPTSWPAALEPVLAQLATRI
jgi:hypothetical protein